MTLPPAIETFIEDFSREIEEDNAAIFAGAGLSVESGSVGWATLLEPIAKELGLDINIEHDLVSLAQYYKNENNNRDKLNRILLERFSDLNAPSDNHKILARLPISTYWTTNYDHLIETALKDEHKKPDVKHTTDHLTRTKPGRDAIVYKMHGDVDFATEAILLKEDYETYYRDRSLYLTALAGDLISKMFLFIGFSFSDPNIDYILSRVRLNVNQKAQRQHYAIIREINKADYDEDADYQYEKRRQQYFIGDLKRFGVKALLIDEYSQITEILNRIHKRVRSKSVFISGAAENYGHWTNKSADILIRRISSRLINWGFNIVSGFGWGVGSSVITGALEQIYKNNDSKINERLLLRPFPQGEDHKLLWPKYREELVSHAGIAIFMFGNKLDASGGIINSNGLESEFELAHATGAYVIPVGATGFMSEVLWNRVMDNFSEYYPDHPELYDLFKELGDYQRGDEKIVTTLNRIMTALK